MSNRVPVIVANILKKPYSLLACACVLGLAGCADVPFPGGSIPLVEEYIVDAATVTGDSVTVPLTPFCNLFDLDQMLVDSGFGFAAGLVRISKAELTGITVSAVEGNFDDFTQADVTLISAGSTIDLGSAQNPAGTTVELVPDAPVNLLTLLNGDCGITTLNFLGKPQENITLRADANLDIVIHVGLF